MKKEEVLQIKSEQSNTVAVQNFIEGICDHYNIHNYFGTISMAVLEAVENAIKHGNKGDKEKTVSVGFSQCDGGLRFRVTDEGQGFDHKQFQGFPEEAGSGEGLFLMQTLSNEIAFSDNGSSVELTFLVNGIDVAKSVSRQVALKQYFNKQKVCVS